MSQMYIPIIGQMSAGKSNFLNAFLGLEVLETGTSTTTKFICLIKNSSSSSFYHVIPTNQNGNLYFNKEGDEIRNLEEIKKKIKNINEQLNIKRGNKNDIFYCLETPLKNKLVNELLGKYTFMDIPGLNEDGENYFDEIFTILTLNDIFFEIIIFDSENGFGGKAMNDIIKRLKDKNCLKKKKNLIILNKIDKRTNQEEVVKKFKKFFYDNFQDLKQSIDVEINIYDNEFVPLSSLLYQAEIKYKEDFYSFLFLFLFQYIKELTKEESFIDFLERKIKNIIIQNNIDNSIVDEIEDEINNLSQNDEEVINKSLGKLRDITKQVRKESGFSLGLEDEIQDEIKKIYLIFKRNLYKNYCFSENYKALESAIKNIVTKNENLECPPVPRIVIENDDILNDMLNFFKQKLKNQFEENNIELSVLRDNLYGNKIRIAFIGNISVGKSTLLNCIIGEDILPTDEDDCTFRAIIIKHKNINEFFLYETRETEFGRGSKKYISFVEKDKYYCRGIKNIKSYLTTKNSDKEMNKADTALIIQGRLRIFDFIKFDGKLIEKIEFIDLPGLNRKDGKSLNKDFYSKILEYCNSCLYINLPTLKDSTNVSNIKNNYENDRKYISVNIRNEFLSTCLFIINKADEIHDESEKKKIEKYLIEIISKVETQKDVGKEINICFFSGKYFLRYLEDYKFFVEMLEMNPFSFLYILYEEYSENDSDKIFSEFVTRKVKKITEYLKIKLNNKISISDDFNKKMISAFGQHYQATGIKFSEKDQKEIIKKLYSLNYEIKNHDFSKTNFSQEFFQKLREVIIKSDNLQKKNLKLMIDNFFQDIDNFFKREAVIESEKQKQKNQKKYDIFKNKIIPKIDNLLNKKSGNLKTILEKGKKECEKLIDDEIENASSRLDSADGDFGKAASNFESKMKTKIDEMRKECENEVKTIGEEIKKESEEAINTYFDSKDFSFSKVEILELKNAVISLTSGALGAIISGVGLYAGGAAIAAGVAAGTISLTTITSFIGSFFGPIGIVGGLVVGGIIGGIVNYFRKSSKYADSISDSKPKIIESFSENEKCIINDFEKFRTDLNIELKKKLELFYKSILFSEEEWDNIKQEYQVLRQKTFVKLKDKFSKII